MKGKGTEEISIEKEFNKKVKKYRKIVGVKGTWGKELDRVGKSIYGSNFCGIYTQNDLPWSKIKKSKCMYGILNNDIEGPGEHWIAFHVKDSQFYCWDSYGRSMKEIVPVLEKKLKSQRIRYKANDKDANQKNSDDDCGARCLAWLHCVKDYGIRKSMKI